VWRVGLLLLGAAGTALGWGSIDAASAWAQALWPIGTTRIPHSILVARTDAEASSLGAERGVESDAISMRAFAESTGALDVEDWSATVDVGFDLAAEDPLRRIVRVVYAEGSDLAALAAQWRARDDVAWASPERSYRITGEDAPLPLWAPNDPLFVDGSQWGLFNRGPDSPFPNAVAGEDVRAREGWAVTTGSTAVTLGVVDTGTDLGHPELAVILADGTPRITAAYNSSDEGPQASAWDSVGHGTMVAGVAAARTNDGPHLDGRGVAGMCGGSGGDSVGCRLVLVKATPTHYGDALSSELARGILYAVDRGARAINLSFAGDDEDPLVLAAMSYAARRGAVVVCGAGNGQDARLQYPGAYARYGVGVSVAAIRPNGQLARFSTRGSQIDVAAPGEDIWSIYLRYKNAFGATARNYQFTSGTSFSAPFVTGLAGLALSLQPSLMDNEYQAVLRATARDVGAPGRDDTYGWGVPDAGVLLRFLAPPAGIERGTATAQTSFPAGSDSITLRNTRVRFDGCATDGRYWADRYEVRAEVSLPPGRFLEPPLVVVRPHASRGWGPGTLFEYDFGWGEVVPGTLSPNGFTLRTYVYDIPAVPPKCPSVTPTGFMPVSPSAATFGWSAIGALDQPPFVRVVSPASDGAVWPVDRADTLRWEASDPDTITGFEVAWSSDGGATWRIAATLPGTARSAVVAAPCDAGSGAILRLRAMDGHVWSDETAVTRAVAPDRACLPGEDPSDPHALALLPVVPNPAHGGVTLRFAVPDPPPGSSAAGASAPVVSIYDSRGRLVRRAALAQGPSAPRVWVWDGRDGQGRAAAPGMYFALLAQGDKTADSRRFVYLGSGAAP
jgi:hypothetical protein